MIPVASVSSIILSIFWFISVISTDLADFSLGVITAREKMALEQLSWRHAIKVAAGVNVSAEECRFAVGEVVGHERTLSASRINNYTALFLRW